MKWPWIIVLIAALWALVSLPAALAKEIVAVRISGAELEEALILDDEETLVFFSQLSFGGQMLTPPQVEGAYYEIRLDVGHEGEVVATNVYHYYPATDTRRAYWYYADVERGWSSAEGEWFHLTTVTSRALAEWFADLEMTAGAAPANPCAEEHA